MPILNRETNLYPDSLLEDPSPQDEWLAVYTRANREKDLMRRLLAMEIPFYCPIVEKTWRSPKGRLRRSWVPLFASYVFVRASGDQRYQAMTTNCISTVNAVPDGEQLRRELCDLERLINTGEPVTIEHKLKAGQRVRVRSGSFAGCEGIVTQRRGKHRLLVNVTFVQRSVSVALDDFSVEPL